MTTVSSPPRSPALSPITPASKPPPHQQQGVTQTPTKPTTQQQQQQQRTREDNTQKRLFRSISRFLNRSRTKSILTPPPPSPSSAAAAGATSAKPSFSHRTSSAEQRNGIPEEDGTSVSTRSMRAPSASTSDSRNDSGHGVLANPHVARLSGASQGPHAHLHSQDDGASAISTLSGADTDASIRPISPSSFAPSFASHAHSNSTSTNASIAKTFKSYASTKPTTLLSIDSSGGANRIAVVPGTGAGGYSLPNSASGNSLSPQSAGAGITFSSLPASTPSTPVVGPSPTLVGQVPHHTLVHPRNNPHPTAPPPDNASMLTLASSSFAPSIFLNRSSGGGGPGWPASSLLRAKYEADEDASVRALAPSRRASDESLASRSTWSAAVLTGRERDRGDGTASLRSVGTAGTGKVFAGTETEAQKVVRMEELYERRVDHDDDLAATTPTRQEGELPISTSNDEALDDSEGPVADESGQMLPPPIPSTSKSNGLLNGGDKSDEVESEAEGVTTPKKDVNGKDKDVDKDAVSMVSGYETDAQSFVDAPSALATDVEDD